METYETHKELIMETHGGFTGEELSAVAVSPWLVACGLSNGEVRLFAALHGLAELGPLPMRHAAEVLSLSFGQLGKVCRSNTSFYFMKRDEQ